MENKGFELEDNLSEASEKEEESILTWISQPISKVASDRIKLVSSQAFPDGANAQSLLAFTRVPITSEPTTSASLFHAVKSRTGNNHGDTSLSDSGIYNYEHRACYRHHLLFLYRQWIQTYLVVALPWRSPNH